MNTSEREQLSQFLQQLTHAQAGPKDEEAQGLINRAMGQQPDAAYLLVQRALLQDGALKVAQERISALQEELKELNGLKQPARGPGGFLDANAWGRAPVSPSAAAAPTPPGYGAPQAGMQAPFAPSASAPSSSSYYPPSAPVAAAAAPSPGFQAPSFLTSMATTAAGVAAGAFLFQGIGHLMGGMGGMGGHQNTGASAFGLSNPQALESSNAAPQTEVINNYFDNPRADSNTATDSADPFLDASQASDTSGFDSAGLDLDTSSDDWS